MIKRVLVLGGHGDIGAAISKEITAQFGANVLPVGRADFDLTDTNSIDSFLLKNGNNYDVLIHSAGWNVPKPFASLTMAEIEHSVNANLMGFIYLVKRLMPYWQKQKFGRIVVLSSIYGFIARNGRLPYVISKHGLLGAVKTFAIEFAPYNVMVNAISPGYIDTKLTAQNNTPETVARLVRGIPVGRMGTPQEIAKAACFLSSPDNTYITGQNLVIDGGYTIGGFQE